MAFGNQLDYFISFLLFSIKAVKLIHSLLHCVYLSFQSTPKLFEPNVSYLYFLYLIQYFISDSSCIWSEKKIFGVLKQQQMQCSSKIPAAEAAVLICNSELLQNVIIWWGSQPNSQASYHHISVNPRHIKMIFQSIFIGGKHARLKQRQRSEVSAHRVGGEQREKLNGLSAEPQTTHLPN